MAWLGNGTMVFVIGPPQYGGGSYMETYGLHTDYMTLTTVDTWGAWQIDPYEGYTYWFPINYIYVQEPNYIMFRYNINPFSFLYYIIDNRTTVETVEGPAEGGSYHYWDTYGEAWDYYNSRNPENYYNLVQGASQINGIKSIII
jgi:hypothetical protein